MSLTLIVGSQDSRGGGLEGLAHSGIIVTDYVNPQMAERIKRLYVAFIATVGNAFLNV